MFVWIDLVKKKNRKPYNIKKDNKTQQHIAISKHNASANKLLFKLVYMTPKESGSPKNKKNAGK